ncbi:synaptotagmin-like protein 2 isoform X17 [Ranitomeya imitator]|uniref:synaptotagmin-like protein 2 isoform X17 n=1 Tax=Ranitomeya imitator TaxID=111125 RepID=UPI0037E813B4
MIDLSFLTDAEKEAILKVLNRDSELKKAEEQRIRHLQDEVNDENELKYKSGQWFYEAKSRRHRDKIHGADLVRASIRKRKNPATIELYGVMEPPDEAEEDRMPSNVKSIQSTIDRKIMNGTASPAKQRKNPFNLEGAVDEMDLHNEMSKPTPEPGLVNGQLGKKSDIMSSIIKYGVKLPYPSPIGDRKTTQETEENTSPKLPPVPKPRKLLINGKPPERSNSSLQREDSINKRKGILKRRSSSSSTDSESIRILPNVEALKLVLPTSPILEAEQTHLFDDQMTSSENSPDRQKQVRFSEYVLQKPPTPNPESYHAREIGEFGILDPSSYHHDLDNKFLDHHPYEEPRPTYSDVDYTNTMEDLDLKENPEVSSTLHAPSNSSLILDAEKKLEDQSQELNYNKLYEIPGEIYPEIDIDSAGTEALYAVVKKPFKSSSPDQEKDKKPDTPSEKSNTKKGMDESHPILNALKRSAAKTLNSKAVQEVSPTSTNEDKLENPKEDTLAPLENSFPENAEKFKRMSQSVPTFLQDDTDGRETDSASESSFQIGRHKKSPSSLTNLSGSSGMASMSSVSGSVMSVYSGDFGNVDIKGNIEYSIEYVEQLKEFLIYIYQCKDLAAADVKKQRSDPYVKAYLLPEKAKMGKRKTAVKKKTLNPVYNEILRYKIPKESLQAQTLNLSVWHRDVLGRNSFLGEVNQDLANWEWENKQKNWYPLEPRTLASSIGLENRGEMKLSLQYIPVSPSEVGKKPNTTGEVHIWIRECIQLPMLRENKINSFVKCTILPDTSRKSRQKTRTVDKTPNPIFNHTMVYDGFKEDDLREACVELTVWDHNKLTNHFLGGIRIGQGTGKSYGTPVDWMDSSPEESTMWQKMIASPNTWIDGMLPLRMFKMAKLAK